MHKCVPCVYVALLYLYNIENKYEFGLFLSVPMAGDMFSNSCALKAADVCSAANQE